MAEVLVSLGSNINRHYHLCRGLDALEQAFGKVELSSVYESDAVGFSGDPFFNLVAEFQTELQVGELSRSLKFIEDRYGRCRKSGSFGPRTLDIDILTYDDKVGMVESVQLPRDEIVRNAFVLWPLAELRGEKLHPILQRSYAELWSEYDKSHQKISPVSFEWHSLRRA